MWQDFKAFVMRGNVMDLAVGVIIGAAFGTVVKSLVDDVIMPPVGLATGGVDFAEKYVLLKEGTAAAAPYPSRSTTGSSSTRSSPSSLLPLRFSCSFAQ